ncbi:integral membrane protein MviN [Ammonifex degensii KC4]|uniref:Probable lipid II flippase MurJ n=1 Tax=Ammonifex degensii (strain DSM 10501 / KC4) TaxID=429009 RepID=C9R9R6_AMMDK|nr:murein biosynthesis integral membrane protein MurJ [Ammonifex degensii]ACX53045.1 integral membrane protein MviN [Ammonifex degensii KC4]
MAAGRLVFKATLVIAFFSLLARLLGFVRDVVIAHLYGASAATDAYLVAFTIPNLLLAIVTGALATVVVPIFAEYAAAGRREEGWRVFNWVFNILTLALLLTLLLSLPLAPWLVLLVAPGLPPETMQLAVELTRIMLPILLFFGWANYFTGLLNANQIFGLPAASGAVNNIVIIASALSLGTVFGIRGLAWGTVLGMLAAALVQLPALRRTGFYWRPEINWRHPGVKKVFALLVPVAVGVSINQAYVIIDRILASGMAEGSISALNFANKLVQLPIGLFILALGTAVFPTLTHRAAEGQHEEVGRLLDRALRFNLLLTLPAAVGLMVLRYPIVSFLFERGAFDARATSMTAAALLCYAVGMVGYAANILLTRGFYALHDTKTPVKLTLVTVIVNLILSLILMHPLKHAGLALANSLAAWVNTFLLYYFLAYRLPALRKVKSWPSFALRSLLACALLALAAWGIYRFVEGFAPAGFWGEALSLGSAIVGGVVFYALSLYLLRFEEWHFLWRLGSEICRVRLLNRNL